MGSSLIMSKRYHCWTPTAGQWGPHPQAGSGAIGSGHTHTHTTRGSGCTWKHKRQPCGFPLLPPVRERSGRTHTGRRGSCPRERALSLPLSVEESWGRRGRGRDAAIWFCIAALFFLHHFVFPVITLDFRILYLFKKKKAHFPPITWIKGIYMACRMRNSSGEKKEY